MSSCTDCRWFRTGGTQTICGHTMGRMSFWGRYIEGKPYSTTTILPDECARYPAPIEIRDHSICGEFKEKGDE